MALQTKQGNLFEHAKGPCLIVHGCNAQGKMASGFAATLRNHYPEAYTVYKKYQKANGLKVGDVSVIRFGNNVIVANLVTQEFYGRDPNTVYVDYDAVEKTLADAAKFSEVHNLPLHMPFIGGGLANGDREVLLGIFNKIFANTDATLWLI